MVGKHLDGNTRLLAEILLLSTICFRVHISLFQSKIDNNVTTPQPPYGGSYREANTGTDGLGGVFYSIIEAGNLA